MLVQRGRGGGLAGALGGMGGSSAFGAKAGDVFTKITAIAAMCWILLCIAASKLTPEQESLIDTGTASTLSEKSSMGAPPSEEGPDGGEAAAAESEAGSGSADEDSGDAGSTDAGSTDAGQSAADSEGAASADETASPSAGSSSEKSSNGADSAKSASE